MQVNLVCNIFILDNEKNTNVRKNDIKKIKVLLDSDASLPSIKLNTSNMKQQIRSYIYSIIGTNIFHLEQSYTLESDKEIDINYIVITNIENIKNLNDNYNLVDFYIKDNNKILFDKEIFEYDTIEKEEYNNIEYIHKINIKNKKIEKELLELLICYKKIRSNLDQTDILFKFMGKTFTLEDVRLVYELIKDKKIDKSNFRKKIIKYCEKSDLELEKNAYRPSQKYRFKPLKGDRWL